MAEQNDSRETVSFEEFHVRSVIEQEALVNLLKRKGIITPAELPVDRIIVRGKNLLYKIGELRLFDQN